MSDQLYSLQGDPRATHRDGGLVQIAHSHKDEVQGNTRSEHPEPSLPYSNITLALQGARLSGLTRNASIKKQCALML